MTLQTASPTTPSEQDYPQDILAMLKPQTTVLIIEDHPAVQRIITRVLQPYDFQILIASNGAAGLRLARQHVPDIILLDVMMPGEMDGFEACHRIRQDPLLADVPILMLTSLDDRASRLKGIQNGADDFITKPFEVIELQARVKNIIERNRYRRLLMERAKFEWVVEGSQNGYVLLNSQKHIIYANERARLYLNLDTVNGRPSQDSFLDIIKRQYIYQPQETWEAWAESFSHPLAPNVFLIRPEASAAPSFWLRVHTLSLPSGTDQSTAIRLEDITGQMISQQDTWRLHAMFSHKLRTPLTSALGNLEIINEYSDSFTLEELRGMAHSAQRATQRLHQAIEDVLRFIDTSAGSLASDRAYFNVMGLPTAVEQLVELPPAVEISTAVAPELEGARIPINESVVHMMLQEIVDNAVKFHPRHTPQLDISATRQEDGRIRLRVMDDGQHLTPEQLIAVWKPYYQAEKYFTGEVPGMGLGLASIATLTWQVGGEYDIFNRPDRPGIVVELIFPPAQA